MTYNEAVVYCASDQYKEDCEKLQSLQEEFEALNKTIRDHRADLVMLHLNEKLELVFEYGTPIDKVLGIATQAKKLVDEHPDIIATIVKITSRFYDVAAEIRTLERAITNAERIARGVHHEEEGMTYEKPRIILHCQQFDPTLNKCCGSCHEDDGEFDYPLGERVHPQDSSIVADICCGITNMLDSLKPEERLQVWEQALTLYKDGQEK